MQWRASLDKVLRKTAAEGGLAASLLASRSRQLFLLRSFDVVVQELVSQWLLASTTVGAKVKRLGRVH